MDAAVAYRPSEWQATFHSLPYYEVLGAGAQGPGKSMALLMEPFQQIQLEHFRCMWGDRKTRDQAADAMEKAGWGHLIDTCRKHPLRWGKSTGWALHLRRTRPMLNQTIDRALRIFNAIDPDAKWNNEQTTWTFRSGFKYQFGHCLKPDDWGIYQSNEYTMILYDELTQFLEEQYIHINLRLRSTDPVLGAPGANWLKIRSCSNPLVRQGAPEDGGESFVVKDPHWVRRRFVEPHPAGGKAFRRKIEIEHKDGTRETVVRHRLYLRATIDDNPDPNFVRQQKASLSDLPEHLRQAYLYGNWFITPGSHFAEEWAERLHVVRPFKIPPHWKRFRSMDWGYKVWGVIGWWAMDEEGNLYLEREFNFRKMTPDIVARRVREIEKKMGLWGNDNKSRITGPADNQIWQQRGTVGKTIQQTFAEFGIEWAHADQTSGSRYNNSLLVASRLADHDGGTTTPGLVFFENCTKTIRTIPAIQSDADDPEVPVQGGDDHWYDMTAYACAYASHGNKGIPSPRRNHAVDPYDEDLDDDDQGDIVVPTDGRTGRRRPVSPYQRAA